MTLKSYCTQIKVYVCMYVQRYANRPYNYQLQYVATTDMANRNVRRMQLIKQEEIGKFSDKKYRLLAIQI